MFWDIDHGNPRIHEEPREPARKGNIYMRQWDTLVVKGEHVENEYWWLVDDRNGQVGYIPVRFWWSS